MENRSNQKLSEENFNKLCPSPTHLPTPAPIHSVCPISVDKLPVLSPMANTSTYLLAPTPSAKPDCPLFLHH